MHNIRPVKAFKWPVNPNSINVFGLFFDVSTTYELVQTQPTWVTNIPKTYFWPAMKSELYIPV